MAQTPMNLPKTETTIPTKSAEAPRERKKEIFILKETSVGNT